MIPVLPRPNLEVNRGAIPPAAKAVSETPSAMTTPAKLTNGRRRPTAGEDDHRNHHEHDRDRRRCRFHDRDRSESLGPVLPRSLGPGRPDNGDLFSVPLSLPLTLPSVLLCICLLLALPPPPPVPPSPFSLPFLTSCSTAFLARSLSGPLPPLPARIAAFPFLSLCLSASRPPYRATLYLLSLSLSFIIPLSPFPSLSLIILILILILIIILIIIISFAFAGPMAHVAATRLWSTLVQASPRAPVRRIRVAKGAWRALIHRAYSLSLSRHGARAPAMAISAGDGDQRASAAPI